MLFVIGKTRRQFAWRTGTYMAVILVTVLSTVMTRGIGGTIAELPMSPAEVLLPMLPLFVLLGRLLGGGLGVLLNAGLLRGLAFADAAQRRLYYAYFAAIGLAMGALVALVPQAVTDGEAMIPGWASAQAGVLVMLLLAAARFCATVASYSTGVPGGIFAPILSLAACVGVAFARAASAFLPDGSSATSAFVIAPMGGLFTASVRSPLGSS